MVLAAGVGLAGRQVRCARCGGDIGRVLPFVRHGRLRVLGLKDQVVHLSFASQDEIHFCHVSLDECVGMGRSGAAESDV